MTLRCLLVVFCFVVAASAHALPPAHPHVTVQEPTLGTWVFTDPEPPMVEVEVPSHAVLAFSWSADASWYGGIIAGYRCGWDLVDPMDPNDPGWVNSEADPDLLAAAPRSFEGGLHTFHVYVVDEQGPYNLVGFYVNVQPFVASERSAWGAVKALYSR